MKFSDMFQNEHSKNESSPLLTLTERKPIEEITKLISTLQSGESIMQLPAGKELSLTHGGERYCCILIEGCAAVRRKSDELMISYVSAPMLVGAAVFFYPQEHHYIHAKSDIKYVLLKEQDFFQKVTHAALWQQLVYLQAFIIHAFSIRDTLLTGRSTYQIVCNQLRMLINEPAIIRDKTSVSRYILERTQLSRSNVMNILSQLRNGSYITMEKGILISIKHLPSKF